MNSRSLFLTQPLEYIKLWHVSVRSIQATTGDIGFMYSLKSFKFLEEIWLLLVSFTF